MVHDIGRLPLWVRVVLSNVVHVMQCTKAAVECLQLQVSSKVNRFMHNPNQTENTSTYPQSEPAQLRGDRTIYRHHHIPCDESRSPPRMCYKAMPPFLHKSLRHPWLQNCFSCLTPVAGEASGAEARCHTADFMQAVSSIAVTQAMAAL